MVLSSEFATQLGIKKNLSMRNYKGVFGEEENCFTADQPLMICFPLASINAPKYFKEVEFEVMQ